MRGRAPDGRSPDERGENLGWSGFEVLVNEPLGLPAVDRRELDDRGLKLGLAGRSPDLANKPPDFLNVDSRESVRGVKLGPAGFLPYFAKALGFPTFDGRSAEGRGEKCGRLGFEVFANELFNLAGDDGRALDEPRLKLGSVPLEPGLANESAGFADIDGRESGRGVNLGRAALSPWIANGFENDLLPFENVEGR